jgi:hypothetical protein
MVFHGYDDNRQNTVIKDYPKIPKGTVVLRKPYRKLSNVPLTVYQVDPEPFVVIDFEGNHVGKYQLKSLVTDEVEAKWYKPYELRIVPEYEYNTLFTSPILEQYIRGKYGDDVVYYFFENLPNKLANL